MLVVGGIKPGVDDTQPLDISGCDGLGKFAQGLGIFSLNNHTWTTTYDPATGSAPYQVHPNISRVIGGNENGGATLQMPVAGFAQKGLGTLLGARSEPSKTALTGSAKTSARPQEVHHSLSGGAVAGIVIALITSISLMVGATVFWFLRRYRRGQRPLGISAPSPLPDAQEIQLGSYSELNASTTPTELRGGKQEKKYAKMWAACELTGDGPLEKPLPPRPLEDKESLELQEMEA